MTEPVLKERVQESVRKSDLSPSSSTHLLSDLELVLSTLKAPIVSTCFI